MAKQEEGSWLGNANKAAHDTGATTIPVLFERRVSSANTQASERETAIDY